MSKAAVSSELFEDISNTKDPSKVLADVYGYNEFRGKQKPVIDQIVAGGDAVVLFPTGAGKSLCYQIPSICREGVGLIISPLIALMRDQVEALKQLGVNAAALNSQMDDTDYHQMSRSLREGTLDLLYVTPERVITEGFQRLMENKKIALFAIDEAHCVSQWGHDFRPEYRQLGEIAKAYPGVPRIALTATADAHTRDDIIERLELNDAEIFTTSFDRPNIAYEIIERKTPKQQLLKFLERHKGASGIVYCLSRKKTEETAAWLNEQNIRALPYHAGLPQQTRHKNQDAFLKEEGLCIVATVAFGMGIDKPNVRYVAHMDLPSSVEAYYQETGRAGRDGLPSEAWMAYGMADMVQRSRMIEEGDSDETVKRVERAKLNALLAICETASCRRQALLNHFGEPHNGNCDSCDTCTKPVETWDGTEAATKALACIYRTEERFGTGHLIDVLIGKETDRAKKFRHTDLKVFGVGKDLAVTTWQSVYRQLLAGGYIIVDHADYGALKLQEKARAVFNKEKEIRFRKDRPAALKAQKNSSSSSRAAKSGLSSQDEELFELLRQRRLEIAQELSIPPYAVFHDATLVDMAADKPTNNEELLAISGVGPSKLKKFGEHFLEVLLEHE